MKKLSRGLLAAVIIIAVAIAVSSGAYYILRSGSAQANAQPGQAPQAVPVSVATVEQRGEALSGSRVISQRELDQRVNAQTEAEANVKAAEATLQAAQLNLDYTQVRAPVAGRVGKLEVTVGNLVAAGPGAPLLTTLVSVNPIYASFDADEHVVLRALKEGKRDVPVEAETVTNGGTQLRGRLQLIDNQVNTRS